MTNEFAPRIAKWVEALRSDEYSQSTMSLRTDDGFCCLGVACDVYAKETGNGSWHQDSQDMHSFNIGIKKENTELPEEVAEWFGINTSGQFKLAVPARDDVEGLVESTSSLIGFNDTFNWPFKKIADYIENNQDNILSYGESEE